jgi:hypothetical protein
MLRTVENVRSMATPAKRVALRTKGPTVPIVAVAADHAGGVHLALKKRPVFVDFILDLTVVEVEELVERGETIAIVIAAAVTAQIGPP